MNHLRFFAVSVFLATTMATGAAQEPPPAGAFRAVHLVSLTPQQVATLQAWMADINGVLEKAGHKEARYRLYKVIGKQSGKYDFMWESSWPSGAVYAKIHDSPEWKSVGEKHPAMGELTTDEIYNRYVEVLPDKR